MQKETDFYFNGQDESSKLIYTIGILWSQISSKLDSILSKNNLNISKFNILMIIKHFGKNDGVQQNEISKRLLVTASNITKLLDKLEKEGLITRNNKIGDKRVKLIKITENASKLLDLSWPPFKNELKNLTQNISSENKSVLNSLLNGWLSDLNKIVDK